MGGTYLYLGSNGWMIRRSYSAVCEYIQEARLGYISPCLERDKKLMWITNVVLILNILPRIFKAQRRESLVILHIQKEVIYSTCLNTTLLFFSWYLSFFPFSFFILSHFPSLVESSPLFHKSEVCLLHSKPFPILMKVLKFTF